MSAKTAAAAKPAKKNPFKAWSTWMSTTGKRRYTYQKLMAAMVRANGEKPAKDGARQKAWVSRFSAAYHAAVRHGVYSSAK